MWIRCQHCECYFPENLGARCGELSIKINHIYYCENIICPRCKRSYIGCKLHTRSCEKNLLTCSLCSMPMHIRCKLVHPDYRTGSGDVRCDRPLCLGHYFYNGSCGCKGYKYSGKNRCQFLREREIKN